MARGGLKDINYQLMLYMEGVKREFKLIPPPSQIGEIDILFRQIAISFGLYFWASGPLIDDRF